MPASPPEVGITSLELVRALTGAAVEKKASDMAILEMEARVSYCDYFLLCNGTNKRQVRAIAQAVIDTAREHGVRPLSTEGLDSSKWTLIDLGDVVVHVFDQELRDFYDLDTLWQDAPRVDVPELGDAKLSERWTGTDV